MRAKRAPAAAAAALALVGGLLGLGLGGCAGRSGDGVAAVVAARGAELVLADGRSLAAGPGTRLTRGEALRTGPSGSAVLDLDGRRLYLGSAALLAAAPTGPDLLRGPLLVDAHGAGALDLSAGDLALRVRGNGVTRVERLQAVRVGTLDGDTRVRSAGAALDVPALHQALVAGLQLPTATTPLVLRDDEAERLVAPDLVGDDLQLQRTADALDSGAEGARLVSDARAGLVLPASFDAPAAVSGYAPLARRPSETALPLVLGRAAHPDRADQAAVAAATARGLRAQDGSWGVVARLVGATARGADQQLDALLAPVAPAAGGGALLAGPAPSAATGPAPTGSRPAAPVTAAGPGPVPAPQAGSPAPSASPRATRRPRPGGSPSPSPAPSSVVDQVTGLVRQVLPTPTPSPSTVVGGLLAPVLGGR